MRRKNIYLIIGEGGCGKSSIIRALTGTYQSSWMDLQLSDTKLANQVIDIEIWPRSAQEGTDETPEQILQKIIDSQATHILLVLRAWGSQAYIDLIAPQHNIIQVLLISANANLPKVNIPEGINVEPLTNSKTRPINANAALIRGLWGWS
jgi:energy-coupling factor transporter ATP-binding protein EcfA2